MGRGRGRGNTEFEEREAHSVRRKMSSKMDCTTWGTEPVLCNNYRWKANVHNCIIRKKRKDRAGRKVGKKARKTMVFGEVTKPTLIRPFLAKEFRCFF